VNTHLGRLGRSTVLKIDDEGEDGSPRTYLMTPKTLIGSAFAGGSSTSRLLRPHSITLLSSLPLYKVLTSLNMVLSFQHAMICSTSLRWLNNS